MTLTYTTRPLSDRTWLRPDSQRQPSRFDSTWTATQQLLDDELRHLDGRQVVIEVDVREHDIRLDGQLRANARTPDHPAVVVAFETTDHGPMQYRCDQFESRWSDQGPSWQQNVRAIALTLSALRAVDRYGATDTGQQYQGFRAIGAGGSATTTTAPALMVEQEAERILGHWSGETVWRTEDNPRVYRRAKANAHPDRNGGDRTGWDDVERAARFFGLLR